MEHASSPPLGQPAGPETRPPDSREAPRASTPPQPDPWGRLPGPWSLNPGSRMPPRGWSRRAATGASGPGPGRMASWWPGASDTLRRMGGLALLGCSLWLVAILVFFRSILGMFS